MKVIHFIPTLCMGGAETLVKDYALGFDKSKIDLTVICIKRRYTAYEKLLEKNNINVIYLSDKFPINLFKKQHGYLIGWVMRRCIRKIKPDVLHFHLSMGKYILIAHPNKTIRIFRTVHNEPKKIWFNKDSDQEFDFWCTKRLINKYNMQLIALHDDMRKELNKIFHVDNTVVVNNGINFERFNVSKSRKEIRSSINIPSDAFLIGHVGRFAEQKNHAFLIDVFKEIHCKINSAHLLLIGTGDEEEKIKTKVTKLDLESSVTILHNRMDVPELMYAMDRFVFPSLYEGLSVTLVEAQKMHLPCIISDRVNDYTVLTNLVIKKSLNDSAADWANTVINFSLKESEIDESAMCEWDMEKVCRNLEDIYAQSMCNY